MNLDKQTHFSESFGSSMGKIYVYKFLKFGWVYRMLIVLFKLKYSNSHGNSRQGGLLAYSINYLLFILFTQK